ncbi:unnamed protein product, partial [Rotaria sordida]
MSSDIDKLHILLGYFLIKNGFIINSTRDLEIINFTKTDRSVTTDFYRNQVRYQAISTVATSEFLIVIEVQNHRHRLVLKLDDYFDNNNRIAHDSIFTSHLSLMECSSDNSIYYALSDSILDRFCSQILSSIHHKINWLNLESTSIERILLATNYSNLYGLGLYNINVDEALSLFT